MTDFSDYIIYADESGAHGLVSIDPEYPVFALTFCMIRKSDYIDTVVPGIQRFKFDFWGHDAVILHERDIRKNKGDFAFLMTDEGLRNQFYQGLNKLINDAPITLFASVINKFKLKKRYSNLKNPYQTALLFCMQQLLLTRISHQVACCHLKHICCQYVMVTSILFRHHTLRLMRPRLSFSRLRAHASSTRTTAMLSVAGTRRREKSGAIIASLGEICGLNLLKKNQTGKIVHIILESRGKKEDLELETEFNRIRDNDEIRGYPAPNINKITFNIRFVSKTANSTGLQLADLMVRPIALHTIRPEQPNRAYEIVEPKLAALKNFP